MDPSSKLHFGYALVVILAGSLISSAIMVRPAFADHTDIFAEIDGDFIVDQGDTVVISGEVDGADDNDQIDWSVEAPGPGDDDGSEDLNSGGEFDFTYEVDDDADDGAYVVEIEFGSEDPVFLYFIVDEDNDNVDVEVDDTYSLDDDVTVEGNVGDDIFDSGIDIVEITILDPNGDEVVDGEEADVENNGDFTYDEFTTDDGDNAHGMYVIKVSYDGDEEGWAIFEVEEDGGSGNNEITATLDHTSYNPGDEVVITGSIDENDVDLNDVLLTVEAPDNTKIVDRDNERPDSNGEFEFSFDLEDDADTGTYDVTLEYEDYDDKTLTFTVSTSSSGGSGGSSGSDGGLTAKVSKSSLLAGETLTVSGEVPRIVSDENGVSITISTPGNNFIAAKFPEPESDKSYSASFLLSQTLEEDDDYRVVVSYDDNEVELSFDITGKTTGSTGPITVSTDKTSYSIGSTVRISGEIADELFLPGQQITLQVFNPEKAPYRFDPIEPEDDGTYSYSMTIGGPLGVSGEWDVKVTYNQQVSQTTFDLTGGVAATPTFDLKYEDQTFTIKYESDGTINSMYVRPLEKKLVVAISDDQDGKLTITLPREVIDAVQAGSDIKYIVTTLDTETGTETSVDITESTTNAEERTIIIDYEGGTDLIEIQGTTVVPEFGAISAIVLAIAIFGIIAVTARFTNKFSSIRHW